MKQRVALFDEIDKFVLVSDSPKFAFDYLDNVLGTGSALWANGFTDKQLQTIPLAELLKMTKPRVRNSNG
jgi:hypothetical protein